MAEKRLNTYQKVGLTAGLVGLGFNGAVGLLTNVPGTSGRYPGADEARHSTATAHETVKSEAAKFYKTIGTLSRPCSEVVIDMTQDIVIPSDSIVNRSEKAIADGACANDSQNDVLAGVVRGTEFRDAKDSWFQKAEELKTIENSSVVRFENDVQKGLREFATYPFGVGSLLVGAAMFTVGSVKKRSNKD